MRQYKLFILFIQVAVATDFLYGGFERTAQPTAVFGRAMSGAGQYSLSNIWLNPASIGKVSSFHSSIFYSPSPFQLPQLTNYGLLTADNIEFVKTSIAINSIGFALYRETLGSFTIAYSDIPRFSFGVMTSVYHLSIDRYGSETKFGIDAGAIYSFTDEFNIGFSIQNLNGISYGGDDDVPRILLTGLSYQIVDEALINFDLVKDIRYELTYRAGIEFSPHEIVTLRTGVQGEPSRLFGGIGIAISTFIIDYSAATHQELGLTHSIGISFTP